MNRYLYRSVLSCVALALMVSGAAAQMENDGIMIPRNYICAGLSYSNSTWSNYWEGTYKRNNGNIGTVSSAMYSIMATYGVSNNLVATLSAPYLLNRASAGTLRSQRGLQDLSLNVKWRAFQFSASGNAISIFASVTGVVPMSNYQADYLPLALGSHSKDFSGRAVFDYARGSYFFTGSGAYMSRSNISIDRDSYYTTTLIYSNQVQLPNMTDYNFRTGYRSKYLIAEAVAEISTSLGGFDIRRNDMPFPSNRMNMSTLGGNLRYRMKALYGLEFEAGDDYVVSGRNVGQSNMVHGSLTYIFGVSPRKMSDDKDSFKN